MNIFQALILGIVQGLTEFIPVSSSGHLIVMHNLLGVEDVGLAFDVALHVGTLLALVAYFGSDLVKLALNITKPTAEGKLTRLIILATIPALVAGYLLRD